MPINLNSEKDTITALGTPPGSSGIGIVRLSGPDSVNIAGRIFRHSKRKPAGAIKSHKLYHGVIYEGENIIDEVLLSVMLAPNSFTREDIVEINCHGGSLPLRKTLELCLKEGARLAEPGEFTKRAYLNGRIDLAQAEAIIDIINARSEAALKAATSQLEGAISDQINSWRDQLLNILAHVEVNLDFPDEDIEESENSAIKLELSRIEGQIASLIASFEEGRLLREGITVVLAGRPNVGKSSLLNCLLKKERAIVTAIPGTTRDTIEESLQLAGFPIRLIDTAGITDTEDLVEKEGIRRSQKSMELADLILLILDGSQPFAEDDLKLFELIDKNKAVIVINKQDMPQALSGEFINSKFPNLRAVKVCAKKSEGIENLEAEIVNLLHHGRDLNQQELLLTNLRHRMALSQTQSKLQSAQIASLPELIATDIQDAISSLEEIIGLTANDDLLDRIFSGFCIGK